MLLFHAEVQPAALVMSCLAVYEIDVFLDEPDENIFRFLSVVLYFSCAVRELCCAVADHVRVLNC